ncbi:MAG: PAAR domain-containing protein [Myxococcota bacterium]
MGKPAARMNDNAQGTPHCHSVHPWSPVPHPVIGPITAGSPNTTIEGMAAARLNDPGAHSSAVCCGPNTYIITQGSSTVTTNDLPQARLGDQTLHCGMATGAIIMGAGTVLVG